jgi:hypothetical protein
VTEDVRRGYVSPEGARRDYGVAIDPATFKVDAEETRRLRAEMKAKAPEPVTRTILLPEMFKDGVLL